MSLKALMGLIALSVILLTPLAMGDYQVFSLWHYNVSLDFGGKEITVEPQSATSDINSITRSIIFRGDEANDWGAVYLMNYREPMPIVPEDRLRRMMMPTVKAIEVDSGPVAGVEGMVAEGDARVEHGFGQRCYGAIAVISPSGMGEKCILTLIGHFTNESLNRQLIQTAHAEYAPQ